MGDRLLVSMLVLTASAAAGQRPDSAVEPWVDSLELRVRSVIAADWGVDVDRLVLEGRRVSEHPGSIRAIDVQYARRSGRVLVTFSAADGRWTTLTRRAGVHTEVPVAARLLRRGDTIDAGAVRWEDRTRWGPPGPTADSIAIGWLVRGLIRAGQPLTRHLVRPPPTIHSGAMIQLEFREGPITLTLQGLALSTGYVGDSIPVRLHGNRDRVFATITGPSTAQLHKR